MKDFFEYRESLTEAISPDENKIKKLEKEFRDVAREAGKLKGGQYGPNAKRFKELDKKQDQLQREIAKLKKSMKKTPKRLAKIASSEEKFGEDLFEDDSLEEYFDSMVDEEVESGTKSGYAKSAVFDQINQGIWYEGKKVYSFGNKFGKTPWTNCSVWECRGDFEFRYSSLGGRGKKYVYLLVPDSIKNIKNRTQLRKIGFAFSNTSMKKKTFEKLEDWFGKEGGFREDWWK